MHPDAPLRGDLAVRHAVDTDTLPWQPSPGGRVLRRRLHRVGPAESGQVTSLVRYEPGSRFPAHDHPEGEEILVLQGVFSDDAGDWPAGSYLLNPEGFRHAPFSREGCLLFVKLRQYGGPGRVHVATQTSGARFAPSGEPGVERLELYHDPAHPDRMRLERWAAGAHPEPRSFPGGAELLVLEGALEETGAFHGRYAWLRIPPGGRLEARTHEGCLLYVKEGGVAGLRTG